MFSGHLLYWSDWSIFVTKNQERIAHSLQFLIYCDTDRDSKISKVTVKIISMAEGQL